MAADQGRRFLQISLTLSAAFSWLCLLWVLASPSESSSAVFLGYSAQRMVLAALLLALAISFGILAFRSWRNSDWLASFQKNFDKRIKVNRLAPIAAMAAVLVASWALFFIPTERAASMAGPAALYLDGLRPLLLWTLCLAAIWLAHLLFRDRFDAALLSSERPYWRKSLLVFGFFVLAVALVALTGIGLGFDASVWNSPGTPLLASQVVLLLAIVPFFLLASLALLKRLGWSEARLDFGLAALIWLLAAATWLAQPAQTTYYESPPVAPNFEAYPLSDAFNHDVIANNVLVGEGFSFGDHIVIRRPLYVMFLAGVEALFGANYNAVIFVQVLVLALFPAFAFFIGLALHNRFSGLLIAGLLIFREANSILLGHVINASHAKMLMADLPTAVVIAAITYAVIRWLQKGVGSASTPLLVGGLIGAGVLLRSQVLTIIPFLLLPALFTFGFAKFWRQAVLLLLGVLLVIGPWIARNRVLTGQFAIEDAVVAGFLANRYRLDPDTFGLPFLAGETEGEFYARQMASVRDFAIQNPMYVAGFVADNYVRNQSLNLLSLPVSLQLRDLEAQVRELPYWPGWEGSLPAESYLPLGIGLLLVSIGLVTAWRNGRWIGLAPLFVLLGFTFSLAVARVSGWRYNLPVDWIVLLYFAIGFGQAVVWILTAAPSEKTAKRLLSQINPVKQKSRKMSQEGVRQIALASLLLLTIGLSFFAIETLGRPRYSEVSADALAQIIAGSQLGGTTSPAERARLIDLAEEHLLEASAGRALHPRFYAAGEGIERGFPLVDPMDFHRLTFFMVGPEPGEVIFPTAEGVELPASSDVVVVRCQGAPVAIAVQDDAGTILYISSDFDQACPSN
jgi:hypothetical protein